MATVRTLETITAVAAVPPGREVVRAGPAPAGAAALAPVAAAAGPVAAMTAMAPVTTGAAVTAVSARTAVAAAPAVSMDSAAVVVAGTTGAPVRRRAGGRLPIEAVVVLRLACSRPAVVAAGLIGSPRVTEGVVVRVVVEGLRRMVRAVVVGAISSGIGHAGEQDAGEQGEREERGQAVEKVQVRHGGRFLRVG